MLKMRKDLLENEAKMLKTEKVVEFWYKFTKNVFFHHQVATYHELKAGQ